MRLLVIADRDYVHDDDRWLALIAEIGAVAPPGLVAIQVRAKGATPADDEMLAAYARQAVPFHVPLFLNGDAALAERLGYTGVHWPEADIPETAAFQALPFRSAAVHSVEAARRAERAGANLAVFAPVYAPGSKPGEGVGVDALRAVVEATSMPVFALGGITPDQVAACLEAGAFGVAAVSGVLGAPDIGAAIEAYLNEIDEAMERIFAAMPELNEEMPQ